MITQPSQIVAAMNTTRTIRITVRGRLSDRLAGAFEGHDAPALRRGHPVVGEVGDQAHLHGLLNRIRDLGLELESVTVVDSPEGRPPPANA